MTRTATLHPNTSARVALLATLLALCCALALGLGPGDAGAQGSPLQKSHLPHVVRDVGLSPVGVNYHCDTGVQAQNLSTENAADMTITHYPQQGRTPVSHSLPQVPPLGSTLWYLPDMSDLVDGFFAAIVSSDQPVGAIARTDCALNGKAGMYGQAEPGVEVLVPLVVGDYFGQCSILSVQNPNTVAPVEAKIELYEYMWDFPVLTLTESIGPGTSATIDMCEVTYPNGELLYQHLGSARVTAGGSDVAVQAYVDIVGSYRALYAFNGVPVETAANELYVPLFRSRQRMRRFDPNSPAMDTGIAVVNSTDRPTDVYVTYYGAPGNPACGGVEYKHNVLPVVIEAHSSAVFYQGPAEQPLTGMHPLPEGCVGSAKIVSDPEPVVAIVNDSLDLTEESAAYNAMSGQEAGTTVVLPLFRAGHTAWEMYTGVSVMNTGNEPATVTIEAIPARSGAAGAATATVTDVGVNETALFWPPDFADRGDWADANRSYGSAIVTSDQPVVVIVNDVSMAGKADTATYNGIKVK